MAVSSGLVSIGKVAKVLGVSPGTVRRLTDEGVLPATRTDGQHRRYAMDQVLEAWSRRQDGPAGRGEQQTANFAGLPTTAAWDGPPLVSWHGAVVGLDEAVVWHEVQPDLVLEEESIARGVLQYVFTEMLNNAIDHSSGTTATVRGWSTDGVVTLEVADDGVGVFRRLADGKNLPDLFAAVQELTKGKQTTAPSHHSGEGIFFSSKAVDTFWLEANGIGWVVDNVREDQAVGVSEVETGTRVRFELAADTARDLGDLFREFSVDHEFTRTRPIIKLFTIGVTFVSRSEAKRLLVDMQAFREVVLDFKGVVSVGQGFVDEVFRVWPLEHPGTTLTPVNMNDAVDFMVSRGLGSSRMAGRPTTGP